ncbi:hypothetical protein [Gilvimarinus agarilyticus]|uniref:hypothetical protein n=1 Tax=Gilvimarinus agarilyticus TaxID=679259 RepID=UPI0005A027EA|nr:hypothetical protein [Gilvimarinus agarilyticus]
MATALRYGITCCLLLLSLALLVLANNSSRLAVQNLQLEQHNRTTDLATLPLQQNIIGRYWVSLELNPGNRAELALRVVPDDELLAVEVNGQSVSLQGISRQALRDYSKGVVLPLSGFTPNRFNQVRFELRNQSNPAGFDLRAASRLGFGQLLLMLPAFALLLWALARHLPLSRWQGVILLGSLAASITYLSVTDSYTRTFDVYEGGGHRDYIHYLVEHRSLPLASEGWEYHQPPLYYTMAALAKSLLPDTEVVDDRWAQWLALWLWVVFLWASLATLRIALRGHRWALWLASFSVCFWPSGIVHSIRIGNDVPVYAFYALGFYFTLRWWRTGASKPLLWAAVWAAAALLTKSNALALWAVLGCLWWARTLHLGRNPLKRAYLKRRSSASLAILAVFFTVAVALNLGDNIWHYYQGQSSDWLLSNVSTTIHSGLKVGNEPENYLVFDLATFLQQPFISTWEDRYGRQYFWNFVFRSSLSSEFFYTGDTLQWWGKVCGILLLVMLVGQLYFTAVNNALLSGRSRLRRVYRALPWLLAVVFPLLLLLAYRIKVPLSCNTDFRYIYMALVPLVYWSVLAFKRRGRGVATLCALSAPAIGALSVLWLSLLVSQA